MEELTFGDDAADRLWEAANTLPTVTPEVEYAVAFTLPNGAPVDDEARDGLAREWTVAAVIAGRRHTREGHGPVGIEEPVWVGEVLVCPILASQVSWAGQVAQWAALLAGESGLPVVALLVRGTGGAVVATIL